MKKQEYIGNPVPILDSYDKVTGKAVYGADFVVPGMLYAKILRSPHAHARIKSIKTEAAARMPGVIAVITGKDSPESGFGISVRDEHFFAKEEVRYSGDEVAAVVAVDEHLAEAALPFIEVEYELLPAVLDVREAAKPGAPLVRNDLKNNTCVHIDIEHGDVEAGFERADAIIEETFYLPHQYHAYIEPHAAVAEWKKGRLTVYSPHQAPHQLEKCICEGLDLPQSGFQYIQTSMGGGFGGKTHSRVALLAAMLSKLVGKPVRIALTREEDFLQSMPSVPMFIRVKLGATRDGKLTAKEVQILAENGAYTSSAAGVISTASERVDALYRVPSVHVVSDLVYTNKVGTSAFRGYGNTQMHFAMESAMDILAEKLDIDRVQIRLQNATLQGDTTVYGRRIDSCGLSEALTKAADEINWNKKRLKNEKKARGIGIACGLHVSGSTTVYPYGAVALTRLFEDGTIHVASSEGDIGQGAATVFAIITAQELGIPLDKIVVDQLDTDVTNFGVGAVGSRVTVLGGNAVKAGAAAAKERIRETAAKKWDCPIEEVYYLDGTVFHSVKEDSMSMVEVAQYYYSITGGARLIGEALYTPTGVEVPDKKKYGNYSLGYAFGAHAVELEVDLETGKVEILNYVAVHDSGKILNPMTFEGQVQGAVLTGLGWALDEEFLFEDGRIMNPDFTNYRVPTIMDAPQVKVITLDINDPNGPFGAKSIGEVSMVPVAPVIVNAIADATGIRFTEIPVTPERLYLALKRRQQQVKN